MKNVLRAASSTQYLGLGQYLLDHSGQFLIQSVSMHDSRAKKIMNPICTAVFSTALCSAFSHHSFNVSYISKYFD